MTVAVLLYTMRCNIACAHCSVYSGPKRTEKMTLDQAYELVNALSALPDIEFIDISGGEVTLYMDEVLQVAAYIRERGKLVRITTNGFWARTPNSSVSSLRQMKDAGINEVGLSVDRWHLESLPAEIAFNYVTACRELRMQPYISCVLPVDSIAIPEGKAPIELRELLVQCGLGNERATDMRTWYQHLDTLKGEARASFIEESLDVRLLVNWNPLATEGRAKELSNIAPSRKLTEYSMERCTAAGRMPTVDHNSRLFPCCSPWVNHPEHAFGSVDRASLPHAINSMASSAVMRVIRCYGPQMLVEALKKRGEQVPEHFSGICNLCGLLLDKLTMPELLSLGRDVISQTERMESERGVVPLIKKS